MLQLKNKTDLFLLPHFLYDRYRAHSHVYDHPRAIRSTRPLSFATSTVSTVLFFTCCALCPDCRQLCHFSISVALMLLDPVTSCSISPCSMLSPSALGSFLLPRQPGCTVSATTHVTRIRGLHLRALLKFGSHMAFDASQKYGYNSYFGKLHLPMALQMC
jgi:hypothetical protein